MINLACICIAALNLLVSMAAWIACNKEGQTGNKFAGSAAGAVTVAISLLMLILTAFYYRGGWSPGASANVTVSEAVASINLPNLPPGSSELHIKRVYRTEEIFIKNVARPPTASGDGTPIADTCQTIEVARPVRRAESSGSALALDSFESEKQLEVQEIRSASPAPAHYVQGELSPRPLKRAATPVVPPTCPTCAPEEESLTERTVERTVELKQLPIRDLGSHESSAEEEPEKAATTMAAAAAALPAESPAERHVRLPIRVEKEEEEEVVSTVEDVQVEIVCRRARRKVGTTAAATAAAAEPGEEEPEVEVTSPPPEPSVSYESVERDLLEKVVRRVGVGARGPEPPSLVPFEPTADVFFNIEEERYRYQPDNPVSLEQVVAGPCGGVVERDETFRERMVRRTIGSGAASSSGGMMEQGLMAQQGSRFGFLFPNASCSNICSRCGSFRRTPDGLLYTLCRILWLTLLIVGLCAVPVALVYYRGSLVEMKAAVLAAFESVKTGARQAMQGARSWMDSVHVHPTAVGFAFGVVFMCVILGSAYYYHQSTGAQVMMNR